MTHAEIAHRRLHNQRLAGTKLAQPADVVRWMGAVQAQDYPGAQWAVGQRTEGATDTDLDRALADGTILRTHVLRPTWHLVAREDIRWLLALTGPRVNASTASRHRQLGLDGETLARGSAALADALRGGTQLTRTELATVLQRAGIATDGQRLVHLIMRAELDGVICSGARRGKEFTYALLDERAPRGREMPREEAVAALAWRYFTSHGPATVQDFVWWSGLTVGDARAGLAMIAADIMREEIDGRASWSAASAPAVRKPSPAAYLLPNYDEYIVAYTDRRAAFDTVPIEKLDARGNILFNHMIAIDGRVVGTWRRVLKKGTMVVDATLFRAIGAAEREAVEGEVARYGRFLGMPAALRIGV